jgi:hypothetical protein
LKNKICLNKARKVIKTNKLVKVMKKQPITIIMLLQVQAYVNL